MRDIQLEGVKSEHELIALECEMLRFAMARTIETMGAELSAHYPSAILPGPEKVITFAEAQRVLGISGEESLSAEEEEEEEERRLGTLMMEQGYELVALTQVPWKQRPFYHMKAVGPQGQVLTKSFEVLYRGVEITSGAVREHRYEVLMEQIKEKGMTGKASSSSWRASSWDLRPTRLRPRARTRDHAVPRTFLYQGGRLYSSWT